MQESILNRKTTIGLVVIMLIYVIFRFASPLLAPLYVHYMNPRMYGEVIETRAWLDLLHLIFTKGFGIAVGIFLIFEAKRANYNRTLWFCLGAIFGLVALILFYIFRIYDNTKPKDDDKSANKD
ncbi:MAG: hypothetical protein COA38_08360 [Fluviicola sp.]|nr:MAG: hypothetical protein COA38_08360 [Fluviicola sp.]